MNQNFTIFAPLLKASLDGDGRRRLHGIASSTIKDRHGDTIELSALTEMERTAGANMTIFLNHKYEVPEDVAGTVERAAIHRHPTDPDIHDLALDIVVNEINERAVKAWSAIQNGTQLGLSIGARIPDGGATRDKDSGRYRIQHIDLLETSLVGVPANPRSWVEYAVKSLNGESMTTLTDDGPVVTDLELVAEPAEGSDEALELAKAKKPADHTHPHAHEHAHDHTHWNGIAHGHDHAHTHAHGHDDSHQHADDMQGSEHDHSHQDSYGDTEHPHSETTKELEPDLTGDELLAHLAETDPAPDLTSDGSDGAASAPQEAPSESVPEHGEAPADVTAELDIEPTALLTLRSASDALTSVTRELTDTRSALAVAERERDQAVELSIRTLSDTAALLQRIAATPMGKRTVVTEQVTAFESLKSVYGDAFVDLLTKKD